MEITYTLVRDYYLPNLAAPESPKVGRWGMLRFNYLRKHREALYTIMLICGNLLQAMPVLIHTGPQGRNPGQSQILCKR